MPRKRKVRRICKLAIDFVSLVDRPANPLAEVMLVKRDEPQQEAKMPEETQAVAETAPAAPTPEPVQDAAAEATAPAEPDTADVEKRLTDVQKRLELAELALAHERDLRATVEAADIAKSLGGLNQDAGQFAKLVKSLRGHLPMATWDELHRVFKSVEEQLRTSKLFGEVGSSTAEGSNSAGEEINKAARLLVEKGEATDHLAAVVKIAQSNPALYQRHRRETLGR